MFRVCCHKMCLNFVKLILFISLINVSQCGKFAKGKGVKRAVENEKDGEESSLAFVFDTTGSMHNDLKQLREGAEMILNTALEESGIIGDFVFVPFHDPLVGPATVTRDKEEFKQALDLVSVYGGGDCPEKSLGGIQLALNVSGPKSFIYVFTDATAGDHRLVERVLDAVQRKQSQVVFVLTGHCNDLEKPTYKVYQRVAAASSGQVFNLNKTSVHKVLEFVKSSIKGRTVNLASSVNPAGYNRTQGIPVDSSLGEVTVSVSGAKPQITVVDPEGVQLTGPPKLVTTLDLSEIMVVKVIQPEPGNWSITVGSSEQYSVKVVGQSNLTFSHGFSVEPPASAAETSYRPLEGTYNNMMISLSQPELSVAIDYAEVLNLGGKALFELPLKQIGQGSYLADAVKPPAEFFYIAINGKDENGNELRRVGATAVQAKKPDVPYLSAPRKIKAHAHSRVVLKCKVESLVPVTAVWTKVSERIQKKISSLQTTTVQYVIEDLTEAEVGRYRCSAKNVAGVSRTTTEVVLLVDPPTVVLEPTSVSLERGEKINITCTVFSEALLLDFKIIHHNQGRHSVSSIVTEPNIDGTYFRNITIQDATPAVAGNYTCLATNRGGSTNKTAVVNLQSRPTSQILGSHERMVNLHGSVTIYCHVENSAAILWLNNGTIKKEVKINGSHTDFLTTNITEDSYWTCKAVRGKLEASDSVHITALLKPSVTISGSKNITVLNGTNLEISCQVVGKPTPRVVWYRGSEEKFLNHTLSAIDSTSYRSVLQLNSSVEDIKGTYFCVGENTVGIHEDNIAVFVRRKMRLLNGFNDTSIQLYKQVNLTCNFDSYPAPVITWYHNGTKVIPTLNINLTEENMTLSIARVDFKDLGLYSCEADNRFEKMELNGTLNVYRLVDPPTIVLEPASVSLERGEKITITCTVFSEALLLDFRIIHHNQGKHSVLSVVTEPNIEGIYFRNITIKDATPAVAGNYTCLATNRGGSTNKTAVINLQSPPTSQILGSHELRVKLHDSVTIYCHVENSAAILWLNNGTIQKEVKVNGSHTDFLTTNITEDSDWTCKGVRGKVEASDSVHITAQLKPSVTILGSKNITVLNGTNLEISCEVVGKPTPRVVWYRGSEEKFLNHTLSAIDSITYRSILQLNSSVEDINGTYFCVGENTVGIHEDNIAVFVRRKMRLLNGFNDTSIQLYKQVNLTCNFNSYPAPVITWHQNGTEISATLNINVTEENRTLSILSVDFNDLGLYSCEADNGFEKMELNGTLSVYGLDAPALVKDQSAKKVVKQGESTIFTCSVHTGNPEPTLKWEYKSLKSNEFITLNNTSNEDGLKFTLNNVTASNAGLYRCVAENAVGRDEFDMELVVQYPPQFKSSQQLDAVLKPLEIEAGGTVNFSCDAIGIPPPIMLWTKNGRPIAYGKNLLSTNGSLVIDKVTEYDSGLYSCKAKSPLGSVDQNYTLFVYVPPKISPPIVPTEQEMLEGQLVELPCEAIGVPSPEVLWTHNGELVTANNKYIDEFGIRFVANLTDFGDYTCIAKNRFGNTSVSYSLFIWVPPYIEPPLEVGKNIIASQNTSLQCDVVGFPVPSIQWEFGGKILKENTTDLSFNEIGNIFITNASSKHEGVYACIAENFAGVTRKIFYVTVNEPPKILEDNYTGPYMATNMDSALTIACKVTGKPKPFVIWSKDDVYLDKDVRYNIESNNALTIKWPTEDMSGNYTCTAKNTIDTTNKTVQVYVYNLPTQMQAEAVHPIVTVMEHTNTSIECPTRASHTDTVKWYKDAALVSTGKLQIENISRYGQNTYACVVSNAIGSAYSEININIEWPPKFIDTESDDKNAGVTIEKISNNSKENETKTDVSDKGVNISNNDTEKIKSNTEIKEGNEVKDPSKENYTKNNETAVIKNLNNTVSPQNHLEALIATEKIEQDGNSTNDGRDSKVKTANRKIKQENNKIKVIEVVEGDDTYLDCSVDAKPIAKTHWLFNSKLLVFADRPRLPLLNVRTSNAGLYKCIVGNKHGTLLKEFRVDVFKPPFISEYDVLDVILMEGVNATLDCIAKGTPEPTIQWTFNNTRWHVDDTSLTTWNVTSSSEGVFRCDARNSAGHTHIAYRVGVVVGAKLEDIVVYRGEEGVSVVGPIETELGSHIRVACKAAGKPTPTVQWLRNGKLLSENKQDISYADLIIDGVVSSQAGMYTCAVANEGGNEERNVKIEVLESPKIFRSLDSNNVPGNTVSVEVLSGQAYYLHCHAYGNPVPELYWFREGLPLMFFDDTMISTDYGEVIEVKRALPGQAGNYTCVARNKAGNSSVVYLVDVLVPPPQPKELSRPVKTRVGRPLTLTCPVEGSPTPHVMWNKHPYTEIGGHTPRVTLTTDNATLSINSTQVSDSGNYSCIMSNKAGTTEVTFDVMIEKPPSIAGQTAPGTVEMHDVALRKSIVLKCEADGHPLPKITWLKDTQELSDRLSNVNRVLGNSLLAIWSVTPRDAGQYICVAENAAGAAHTRHNLRVTVPGKWSEWGGWSFCDVTCGLGHQRRVRTCRYLDDDDKIIDNSTATDKFILDVSACKGPANETRKCHMPACEEESSPSWSAWSRWSPCSASCGAGTQARTRRCRGRACLGDNVQIRKCPELPRCENFGENTENDVFDENGDQNENNVYAPEAVFEMEPEIVQSHYSPDVEEFYLATGKKQQHVFYNVAVTSNLDGSDEGPCGVGFKLNTSGLCEDIDECVLEANQCHATQLCVNVAGGYQCSCQPGLLSLAAGQRCMDINECTQEISGCEYACVNVVGGYVCACPRNMRLHTDKHHCYPVHPMASQSYRRPYYEDPDTSEYLSASVEYPARYKHMKN